MSCPSRAWGMRKARPGLAGAGRSPVRSRYSCDGHREWYPSPESACCNDARSSRRSSAIASSTIFATSGRSDALSQATRLEELQGVRPDEEAEPLRHPEGWPLAAQPVEPLLHGGDRLHNLGERAHVLRLAGIDDQPLGERTEADGEHVALVHHLADLIEVNQEAVLCEHSVLPGRTRPAAPPGPDRITLAEAARSCQTLPARRVWRASTSPPARWRPRASSPGFPRSG